MPRWTQEEIHFLHDESLKELFVRFPDRTKDSIRAARAYYLKKGRVMEEAKNEYIHEGKLVSEVEGTWETAAFNRETNEWDVKTLHRKSVKTRPLDTPFLNPVEVAPIKFDRKRATRLGAKTILAFGDEQIGWRRIGDEMLPLHDLQAMAAVHQLARNLQPDVVVNLGDTTDLSELSRFKPDSRHFQNTLQPSLQSTHDWLASITEVTPKAERHIVDSNHWKRFGDYVLQNAGVLAEIPELKLHRLLRLKEIGWQFHGGYGSAEYIYNPGDDEIAFKHGTLATANGSTAYKLNKENPDRFIVQGHQHRRGAEFSTDRKGHSFGAFVVGALCHIDGRVPSFHSAIDPESDRPVKRFENWTQDVLVIRDYGEGNYQFDQVPITNGHIVYEGKHYGTTE